MFRYQRQTETDVDTYANYRCFYAPYICSSTNRAGASVNEMFRLSHGFVLVQGPLLFILLCSSSTKGMMVDRIFEKVRIGDAINATVSDEFTTVSLSLCSLRYHLLQWRNQDFPDGGRQSHRWGTSL